MTLTARVLYLGGARSGKSTAAEARVAELPTTYVATAASDPADPEWQDRIALHRARRPEHWRTEETRDLPQLIAAATPEQPVLIDCLTLWLSGVLDDRNAWSMPTESAALATANEAISDLTEAIAAAPGGVVLVSNEVGSGIVPDTISGRVFRDLLGRCNMQVAAACDEVNLVVAGCVLPVKPIGGSV